MRLAHCLVVVAFCSTPALAKAPTTRRSDPVSDRLDRLEAQIEKQRPAVQQTIRELQFRLKQLEEDFGVYPDESPHLSPLAPVPDRPQSAPLQHVARQRGWI